MLAVRYGILQGVKHPMRTASSRFFVSVAALALIVISAGYFSAEEQAHATLRYWLFNVGQGDAMLLETPERQQIVIDGGPGSDITQLLAQRIPLNDRELDLIILTHNHSDHLTGINELLRRYRVKELWVSGAIHTTDTYRTFLELVREKNIPLKTVSAGTTVRYGALEGVVLWPQQVPLGELPENQNSQSIVTLWRYGSQSLLLTGDMEKEQEQALVGKNMIQPTTVLKVPHQGSRTSSSELLLRAAQPRLAVLSVGKNSYGHPHTEIIERYKKFGIPVLRTDQNGTIRVDFTLNSFTTATER